MCCLLLFAWFGVFWARVTAHFDDILGQSSSRVEPYGGRIARHGQV